MGVSLDLTNQRCQKAEAKAKQLEGKIDILHFFVGSACNLKLVTSPKRRRPLFRGHFLKMVSSFAYRDHFWDMEASP